MKASVSVGDKEEAMVAAIIANPADDVPRLAYADYLDEHDQPEVEECRVCANGPPNEGDSPDPRDAKCEKCGGAGYFYRPGPLAVRAEFIRVQCEIARLEQLPASKGVRKLAATVAGFFPPDVVRRAVEPKELASLRERESLLLRCAAPLRWVPSGVAVFHPTMSSRDLFVNDGIRFERGFIAEVHVPTLSKWTGCEYCQWRRSVQDPPLSELAYHDCKGIGPDGIGSAICAVNPVELVRVGDREPWETPTGWSWWSEDSGDSTEDVLPREIFALLDGWSHSDSDYKQYSSRADAIAALSRALIAWARGVRAILGVAS